MTDASFSDHDLNKQFDALRGVAAESRDAWLKAKCIALSDERVRAAVLEKLRAGHTFQSIENVDGASIAHEKRMRFDFESKAETSDKGKPSFLVIVNINEKNVASIVDPYHC